MLSPHGLDKDDTANSQPSSENITDQFRGKVILEADFTLQFTVEASGVTVSFPPDI